MRKIWLAEDDEDDRVFFQQALKNIPGDIELLISENGIQLMSVLENAAPSEEDIILLDDNMPKMNGKETLDALRSDRRFASLPVIIFSTSNFPNLIEEMYTLGADYYFIKPDCIEKLEGLITQMLSLSQTKSSPVKREHFVIGEDRSAFCGGLYYSRIKASA